ncbi:unnamed protein product [Ceutorhynchus assimilis]|uniref:THAP-type domain-containing protein n=1 Tax=Ceutorhynchus assimilis TaxID=467358 RepID=A0A9N9MPJ0_9CUCU|nr:unnamed protein product [Ceutorhynchus assimilis]
MSCFVRNCKNIKRLMPVDSQITFHRFPKDDVRFREWLCSIDLGWNLNNIKWSENMFICSEHFNEQDF